MARMPAPPNRTSCTAPNPITGRSAIPPMNMRAATAAVRTLTTSYICRRCRLLGRGLGGGGVGDDNDGRAVGHDLGHGLADLGRVEPERDDRVRAHECRVLDHPVECLAPGVLEQLGVLVDLAAHDRAEAGREVAREAAAAHDEA